MKKLFVLAVASTFATTAMAAEMKWSGSAGWRYEQITHNDGLGSISTNNTTTGMTGKDVSKQTTRDHAIRASLGVTGGWENVEWGVGVHTNPAGTASTSIAGGVFATTALPNSDYTTLGSNADPAIGFNYAWFRYLHDFSAVNLAVTVGRQDTVFHYDTSGQSLFDNDVSWDGFGWNFKAGMFGFNASQYILGARNRGSTGAANSQYTSTESSQATASGTSKMYYLLGFQPYMNWKFSDDIEALFALGYYNWSDQQNTNYTSGGWNTTTFNATSNPTPVAGASYNIHNLRQWQLLANITLPYSLTFTGEFITNAKARAIYNQGTLSSTYTGGTTQPAVSHSAYSLGLKYGKVRKAHDFSLGYAYGKKGLASVIAAYSNDRFLPDNKGHTFTVGYALADNLNIGGRAMFLKEIEKKSVTTGAAITTAQTQKTNSWELTAGVNF